MKSLKYTIMCLLLLCVCINASADVTECPQQSQLIDANQSATEIQKTKQVNTKTSQNKNLKKSKSKGKQMGMFKILIPQALR